MRLALTTVCRQLGGRVTSGPRAQSRPRNVAEETDDPGDESEGGLPLIDLPLP